MEQNARGFTALGWWIRAVLSWYVLAEGSCGIPRAPGVTFPGWGSDAGLP
jgi:hypothetical protein